MSIKFWIELLLSEEEDAVITLLKMQNRSQFFTVPGISSILWVVYGTSSDNRLEKNKLRSDLLSPL